MTFQQIYYKGSTHDKWRYSFCKHISESNLTCKDETMWYIHKPGRSIFNSFYLEIIC